MNKRNVVAMTLGLALCACAGVASPQPAATPAAQPIPTQNMKPTPLPSAPIASPAIAKNALTAANVFGFKLFGELTGGKASNTFISPLSISMALAMAYNGADGKTAQDMETALGLQGMSLGEVNAAYAALIGQMNANPQVTLSIANSLWGRQGVTFKPDFLSRVGAAYDARLTALDFNSPDALKTINGWVSEKTRGKIPDIIDQISPEMVMYLINAVYFKGDWLDRFNPALTAQKPFTTASGEIVNAQMMTRTGQMLYLDDPLFQAVSLPYTGSQLSMIVILPKGNLQSFLPQLTAENYSRWTKAMRSRPGNLQLPRFKMEYTQNLNEALVNLGMGSMFANGANFSKLADLPLAISEVKHKSFVEVNEQGAEAAAVTAIGVRTTSMRDPEESFKMVVDHPFVFVIQDNRSGAVLFLGTMAKI